ncbi:MAG: hypothetical protein IJQ88_00780, partial [Clostridia bacterium]|nr:hypothetical protein [Clostridia bacterium]
MGFLDKLKSLFSRQKTPVRAEAPAAEEKKAFPEGTRLKKVCKNCGKSFSYDPSWEHIPNYCKDCKKKFAQEKEEKQRAGAPRKIRRKCRECGRFLTFPNTQEHYTSYSSNSR